MHLIEVLSNLLAFQNQADTTVIRASREDEQYSVVKHCGYVDPVEKQKLFLVSQNWTFLALFSELLAMDHFCKRNIAPFRFFLIDTSRIFPCHKSFSRSRKEEELQKKSNCKWELLPSCITRARESECFCIYIQSEFCRCACLAASLNPPTP